MKQGSNYQPSKPVDPNYKIKTSFKTSNVINAFDKNPNSIKYYQPSNNNYQQQNQGSRFTPKRISNTESSGIQRIVYTSSNA